MKFSKYRRKTRNGERAYKIGRLGKMFSRKYKVVNGGKEGGKSPEFLENRRMILHLPILPLHCPCLHSKLPILPSLLHLPLLQPSIALLPRTWYLLLYICPCHPPTILLLSPSKLPLLLSLIHLPLPSS
jgi:hypothetical protein